MLWYSENYRQEDERHPMIHIYEKNLADTILGGVEIPDGTRVRKLKASEYAPAPNPTRMGLVYVQIVAARFFGIDWHIA